MTTAEKNLTKSLEDYLEAVLLLVRRDRVARVRDIALHLNVGKPAVTAAMKILAQRELINYEAYQFVTLTARGEQLAEGISQRHETLRRFLSEVLGLDEQSAHANACRMEHVVDDLLLERLAGLNESLVHCPHAQARTPARYEKSCPCGRGLAGGSSSTGTRSRNAI